MEEYFDDWLFLIYVKNQDSKNRSSFISLLLLLSRCIWCFRYIQPPVELPSRVLLSLSLSPHQCCPSAFPQVDKYSMKSPQILLILCFSCFWITFPCSRSTSQSCRWGGSTGPLFLASRIQLLSKGSSPWIAQLIPLVKFFDLHNAPSVSACHFLSIFMIVAPDDFLLRLDNLLYILLSTIFLP